ncbi:PREDICTED: vacuolar protein sorting-associated protein 13A-like [Nicrophorus vespilloides]|uniref:Vacuolar protein sorting-associated protein 13A-like n=1 Tax=Nicrophorus vespilloides TaxID=110193 RepID=A0ABM1N714_NICVS|nr:PREDICTED: vacuolar protein sorting-associated protein 13A-like [Nicrophorus vespilloides]
MLEGAVARVLNQVLGKYVVDLDTENLNVGIFSGQVHLNDLKLKSEALYELNLPIQVIAGTIGKVWLEIPWAKLWSKPVVVKIEDVHILVGPVVNNEPYDAEKNKRLQRAFKKKALADLTAESELIGGPNMFSEYLITNIINNLELTITNVHLRYRDVVNGPETWVLGLCIGNIVAETTNSKWKANKKTTASDELSYYMVKVDGLAVYCNQEKDPIQWDFPSQYYVWRNAMSSSIQTYSMNGEPFEFILKPTTSKIKMTINRTSEGKISKLFSDVIIHDLYFQFSKEQYNYMTKLLDSLRRMFIIWNFLHMRPTVKVSENRKIWWKYAYAAALQQRVSPYSWSKIRTVRLNYRNYVELYKKILLNPNDTELKLDLQMHEDRLSVINIVIARQQARLSAQASSLSEKSFWDILPSPERQHLCEKISFPDEPQSQIDFTYNFRIGCAGLTLLDNNREILIVTMTQLISSYQPNFLDNTYKASLKIEGLIIEGASVEEHLISIVSTIHNGHSPAYFLKLDVEKTPKKCEHSYKINCILEHIEVAYDEYSYEKIINFFGNRHFSLDNMMVAMQAYPKQTMTWMRDKLLAKWDFRLDLKLPYIIIPENGSLQNGEHVLIIDLGCVKVSTEICQETKISQNATQMELEEQMYSRFHLNCSDIQILFCESKDTWKDSRRERDTDLHIVPKTNFSASYSTCVKKLKTLPKCKLTATIQTIKVNLSERKIIQFLTFINSFTRSIEVKPLERPKPWKKDAIIGKLSWSYLMHVQSSIMILDSYINKRHKDRNGMLKKDIKKRSSDRYNKENMNEVWARCVDLPGLEDNISPSNTILIIFRFVVNEFQLVYSRSCENNDRQYMMLRLGLFAMDIAWMTYGPACQVSLSSLILTDKLHTTPSGQYLDLIHSPFPTTVDVVTILYRKVDANCPDFWTHFHGVETSLVADFGTLHVMFHQEAFHTIIKYTKYLNQKIRSHISKSILTKIQNVANIAKTLFPTKTKFDTPVPPGSIKFSHSARLSDLNIRICDSDFDIVNIYVSGFEIDFLFRANERFVFRSFLSKIIVEHLSDVTLYSKVLYTDEDRVFEVKYVRYASTMCRHSDISPTSEELNSNGSLKFHLGQLHVTFLYKLIVQLHRFIVNLEGLQYLQNAYDFFNKMTVKATETLKTSTKINLSINIKGPILLLPQKSSSPNVVIIDTGDLSMENFFKEYDNEIIENILVKIEHITVSRGLMLLNSSMEMQETIIEPFKMNMDVKRFIPLTKSAYKTLTWEIDGIMQAFLITLGQKDLSIILSIYTDNIGEGNMIELFPDSVNSPTKAPESDEVVRNLEAFFCEPKQRNISVKFRFDGINLGLFFDSGELLSSPIRDLNHGLCRFDVIDIGTSFIIYTDYSLDGKLYVDSIEIEEIGPDANSHNRGILQAAMDVHKNNNCHITVNTPPIIDITFHQNKTGDKSIDIIIGRLALCLSVPFCEKLALFVIECSSKDNVEDGIVNHGYICDLQSEPIIPFIPHSITIALRINRPEFIFLVETASNKKRYFTTKMEILIDYSQHSNQQNFVVSLSGLHTQFYDMCLSSSESYTILKQCDVELSKCFSDKNDKITANISSIYVQFCSRVVYSINDILNDIVEHFKVPETVVSPKEMRKMEIIKQANMDNLWDPKKLTEFNGRNEEFANSGKGLIHEVFIMPKTDVFIIFELEEIPVIVFKTTIELTVYDWTSLLNSTCEITFQANYFNDSVQSWEPILDPVVLDDNVYKPWELFIKVFQDKAQPMFNCEKQVKKEKDKKGASQSTTEDEDESGDDMIYLEPTNAFHNRNNRRVKTSLSTFLDDSDSENEDGSMEKLAAAISDLFTGDWNESEGSECEQSSDSDEGSDDNQKSKSNEAIPEEVAYKKATYVLLDSKDTLNFTITPTFLKVFNDVYNMYSNKTLSIANSSKAINLINDIGPQSKVELFENKGNENDADSVLVVSKTYEKEDSCPNSPSRGCYLIGDFNDDLDDRDSCSEDNTKIDFEGGYDLETINSLDFPRFTTPLLYERINTHQLKIHVPGFQPFQTSCPKKANEKLLRLHSTTANQIYYLIAKSSINKHGRDVVVSSPLQIRNETCFALSILYQPSVLQQLNLEPVGDMTNPFETTMRIAVLEPHEQYNVPLYIAYHCKLFIQPAYAEGHYASNTGIWWKDLVTDLDTAHNFHCNPKSSSNLEVFSLRVMLKKNIEAKNSHSHSIPNYVIHLLPPLILHNYLPYALTVENVILKQQMKVEPGEKTSIYSLNLSSDQKLVIKVGYYNLVWTGLLTLTPHLDEKVIVLTSDTKLEGSWTRQLAVNVKAERDDSCNVYIYTPYWIVNKTTLPLHIKASSTNTTYGSNTEDIILFTYKRHGKQSLQLKVYDSDWSNEFGLDCAGATGLVVCKDNERKKRYSFLLSIGLSEMCPRFTKIVTLLPSFLVSNHTNKELRFMEHNEKTDLWVDLGQGRCVPFWPETSSMQMFVKLRDNKVTSPAFFINNHHNTVLRIDKGSAITVNVFGGKIEPFKINFEDYRDGDAPVVAKNFCADLFVRIQQKGQSPVTLLSPYQSVTYTWDEPTKPRDLMWNVYNNKSPGFYVDILKDCYGEERISFHSVAPGNNTSVATISSSEDSDSSDSVKTTLNKKVRRDKIVIYWVSYRDDEQRTLLLTQDHRVYNNIVQTIFNETGDIECLVSLAGMGLSCFTSSSMKKEHLYLSLSDAPANWEVNVGHKWKMLTLELASWIEDKYRLHYKKCQLKDYVHIDFEKMFMLKPFFAELRRTYSPAIYVQLRKSVNHRHINFKINSIQIDNKLVNSNESVVLCPLPVEHLRTAPSFIQFACTKTIAANCDIYRNLNIDVRDFYLNIQSDLVANIAQQFLDSRKSSVETTVLYRKDMNKVHGPLAPIATRIMQERRTIIEKITLTQTYIQLNILNKPPTNFNNISYPITNILSYFFPHNISPYMPIEGVKHKIAAMEIPENRMDFVKGLLEIWEHCKSHFLQQYYAQVLGLQVLVNPHAMQQPIVAMNEVVPNDAEKMSSVILFGCRCLLGHLNMSSVALEQSIMEIFNNQNIENIQRIRRHGLYHNACMLPKSITSSSRNFNPGVMLALDQIIAKSQTAGIQTDGELFFRGTGKALISLVTRHPDEKSNSVHVAMEALKRASLLGEPIKIHQRLTRYTNFHLGLRPFSIYESMGCYLLEIVANGRFYNDTYWTHAAIDKAGKSIIIVSLEHVLRANKCRLWGPWELEWSLDLDEIISVAKVTTAQLVLNIRQGENDLLNPDGKLIVNGDKEVMDWLQEKIEQAIVVSMEDKSWTLTTE